MRSRSPAEIARQSLQILAQRRLPPTPENYQAVYEEVAGLLPQEAFPQRRLRHIGTLLPSQTPRQKQLTQAFLQAVEAKDWLQLQTAVVEYAQLELTGSAQATVLSCPSTPIEVLPASLAEQLARLIENTVGALGPEDQRTQEISLQLVDFLRQAPPRPQALEQMLQNYSFRLSFLSQEQAQRAHQIAQMVGMTVEHLRAISTQDPLLQRLAEKLKEGIASPWTAPQLQQIQIQLKSLLFRHFELHSSHEEAHNRFKELLAQYAQHMADLSGNSQQHQEQLSHYAEKIEQAPDLPALTPLLEAVVASGSRLARESKQAVVTMRDLQEQALAQEQQIYQLSHNLQRMQDASRHDPSTEALNTQGLQETFLAEAARSTRLNSPLSIAVLQVQTPAEQATTSPRPSVGDGLHATHEMALRHLVQIARSTLRPQDAIGRSSEQNLVLIFPDSAAPEASQALARLQQELAQTPLLYADDCLAMALSAGVVQKLPQETPQQTLQRAAQALRQAIRMGGQRVVLN